MSDPALRDINLAYPELMAIRTALTEKDWPAAWSQYQALDNEPMRNAAVGIAMNTSGVDYLLAPIAQAPDQTPEHFVARIMLASAYIGIGWNIRTSARATNVSADQFRQLHEWLRRAEQLLIDVVAHEPNLAPAWTMRLITARGLELGQSEARRRYDHAIRCAPHLVAAQIQQLQQLAPKWSGSLDKMHAFARECAQAAPPGALNPVVIVEAHFEHRQTLTGDEKDAYLASPSVQNDVAIAAAQSVLNPAFRPRYNWVAAHAAFALYQSMVGNLPAAAVHFRALGDWDVSGTWGTFFNKPTEKFQEHRAAALARG